VFGPAAAVQIGSVAVAKRDGTTKTQYVEHVGRPFQVDGVMCVYGYISHGDRFVTNNSRPVAAAARNRAHYASSGTCRTRGCSAPADPSGLCRDCYFDEYDQ
jgi:hypothetical protein